MFGYIALVALGLLSWRLVRLSLAWRRNYLEAKASGFVVFPVPVFAFSRTWTVINLPLIKQLRKLPKSWTSPWLELISPLKAWHHRYSTFRELGVDYYMTSAPGGNMLWICDPEGITQITQRRNEFVKPVSMYKVLDIFGNNVVSSEGSYWRHHRKIVAPPFNEKNNHLVWYESLLQGQNMLRSWVGNAQGNQSRTIRTMQADSMRLSLYVISKAGFGKSLLWPGVDDGSDPSESRGTTVDAGHTMTYTEALGHFLKNLVMVIVFGPFLLSVAPIARMRLAYRSFVEWGKYMREMYNEKVEQMASSAATEEKAGLDLMGAMIQAAGITSKEARPLLSKEEIMGNAFVFILAGHETTANSIHFSLALLASHLATQRRVQAELDAIFGSRPMSDWSYDKDLPRLFGGLVGACMAEQLRLIPPVVEIPKSTETAQSLTLGGKRFVVPARTMVHLSTIAAHRNPKYWPHHPPSDPHHLEHPDNSDDDLDEFKPERWLKQQSESSPRSSMHEPAATGTTATGADEGTRTAETDDLGVNTAADTAASLFKPVRGSFIPFSEGYRSCLGRRFAQVEYMAVMAVLLREWSVELAVDDWVSDEQLDKMADREKKLVWDKAKRRVRDTFNNDMFAAITLQLNPGVIIPLRFVKRGTERFDWGADNP